MTTPSRYRVSIRRYLVAGAAASVLLVGVVCGWATTAEISGAIIAQGAVVVASTVKKVQHPAGGVVSTIAVKDGDHVHAGDLLIRLDETTTRANFAMVTKSLDELYVRRSRLRAERDLLAEPIFSDELGFRADDPVVRPLIQSERRFFDLRSAARKGKMSSLKERIHQLEDEAAGNEQQAKAKTEEIALIERELNGVRELWSKKLLPLARLTALEREATRLSGERAQLKARLAEAKGRIAETELQILQIEREFSAEVASELQDVDGRVGELVEKKVAAEDQLKRVELRAPQDGIVHELLVHTVGGVIGPGETVMLIVPTGDDLAIDAEIKPTDVDQLTVGAPASIRFSAFNQRTTPEIEGRLTRVSADVTLNERTGESHYTVRVDLDASAIAKLGSLRLAPGMPSEVFIKTTDRKIISLLLKPFTDQLAKAFRDD